MFAGSATVDCAAFIAYIFDHNSTRYHDTRVIDRWTIGIHPEAAKLRGSPNVFRGKYDPTPVPLRCVIRASEGFRSSREIFSSWLAYFGRRHVREERAPFRHRAMGRKRLR